MSTVTISKKKLLDSFCSMCDELDIYEHQELDKTMQKKEEWAEKHFGHEIDKDKYE